LLFHCPEWDGAICARKVTLFQKIVDDVYYKAIIKVRRGIITDSDMRDWHRRFFENFVPLSYYAGLFRQHDSRRPCLGIDVGVHGRDGVFHLGSSFHDVSFEMRDLSDQVMNHIKNIEVRWQCLTPEDRIRMLASVIANTVGNFIKIHPFLNGNGRVSRTLWIALLARYKIRSDLTIAERPGWPYGELMESAMQGNFAPLYHHVVLMLAHGTPKAI
jgi:fido (protein-threonine AMPylation protein)